MGSTHNASRFSQYIVDPSIFEGEDPSVCGVVYISAESEGGAAAYQVPKGQSGGGEASESLANKAARRCANKRLALLSIAAVAVLIGIIVGISVGVSKQKRPALTLPQGPTVLPTVLPTKATAAVNTAVPFSVTANVVPPAGSEKYSCDALFGTDEAIVKYITAVQAEYATKLSHIWIDSINVTKLMCNGVNYPLYEYSSTSMATAIPTAATTTTATAMVAAATVQDGIVGKGRKLRQSSSASTGGSSSSSSSDNPLAASSAPIFELTMELEVHRHEYLDSIVDRMDMEWMGKVRQAAADASQIILPKLLTDMFNLAVVSSSKVVVVQLPAVTIASTQAIDTEVPSQEVIRTTFDPLTGEPLDSQTMILAITPTSVPPEQQTQPAAPDQSTDAPAASSSNTTDTVADVPAPAVTEPSSSANGTATDVVNCAAACTLPNAVPSCAKGQCVITRCLPGWEDCDGDVNNGCEADALKFFTDSKHCGGCGKICLAPLTCNAGKCSLPSTTASTQVTGKDDSVPPPTTSEQPAGDTQPSTEPTDNQPASNTTAEQPTKPSDKQQQPTTPLAPTPTTDQPATAQTPAAAPTGEEEQPAVTPGEAQEPLPGDGSASSSSKPSDAVPKPVPSSKPAAPTTAAPVQPPSKPVVIPPRPKVMPVLYDDVVRVLPSESSITIDVLNNDDLGGYSPDDVTILISSTTGAASVVSAAAKTGSSSSSKPSILYKLDSPLPAGHEVQIYYTVAVDGELSPAPATVTLIGAVSRTNPSLLDCSPAAAEVTGSPLPALRRADDDSQAVKLPFAVPLYGGSYRTATVSSNGWVSFGDSGAYEPCNMDTQWPTGACLGTGPVLAVFWDDLASDSVLTYHDKQLDAFIIQWGNVMFPSSPSPLGTFQAYIFRNGSIAYIYKDLFDTDKALGSSAVVGIRGPTAAGKGFASLMRSKDFAAAGSMSDPHGAWLYAAAVDDPDYLITVSAQSRFLSPGLALISHPQASRSGLPAKVPGKFMPWNFGVPGVPASAKVAGPVLVVDPASPSRPVLDDPVTKPGLGLSGSQVLTLSWSMPKGSAPVEQYRLFVAADPLFNELLRQPIGNALEEDIPGSTKSVDIVLDERYSTPGADIYVLLMACNAQACRAACERQLALSQPAL